MALESLDRIDITRLSLDLPESAAGEFDVNAEVTSENWSHWTKDLKSMNSLIQASDMVQLAAGLKVVATDKFSESLLPERAEELIRDRTQALKGAENWYEYLRVWAHLTMVFPDQATRNYLTGPLLKIADIERVVRGCRSLKDWSSYTVALRDWRIVFGANLSEVEEDWDLIKAYCKAKVDLGFMLSKYTAAVRLIFPERFAELELGEAEWQTMKDVYMDIEHPREQVEMLSYLKILAADQVEVTDQGIELSNKPKFGLEAEQSYSPLPEIRNF